MRRRPAVLAFQAAVLTTLVGGTTAFVTLDKTVTLSVDGQEREVRSFARTVEGVLDREGIEVGPHDVVSPAPGSDLKDGQRVSVRYGRLLTLTVDGEQKRLWTTADDVDEALDQLGVRAEGAFVSVSRDAAINREGLALQLRTSKRVNVLADGRERPFTTNRPTVAHVLRDAGVRLGEHDRVTPALGTAPVAGTTITVERVALRKVVERFELDAGTDRRETDELYEGETRVESEGRDGERVVVLRELLVDGEVRDRARLQDRVSAPVDRVVLVGTKERPAPEPEPEPASSGSGGSSGSDDDEGSSGSGGSGSSGGSDEDYTPPSSGGLDWAALAACESGGDPDIVSSNGLYHGLYQFSVSTWRSVGGSGLPSQASPAEQTMRAQMLYDAAGPGQWPVCGSRL
ncbi:resuscitation-promoting factor [Vallicoccus soli]|uniref:resuscitation-promoting factor n=1 Tax=Vallicoccus soli TaxID=2339232 RepID=UPI001401CD5E|nr:resuscitation-promoting factor [Vallicoccus soli]